MDVSELSCALYIVALAEKSLVVSSFSKVLIKCIIDCIIVWVQFRLARISE